MELVILVVFLVITALLISQGIFTLYWMSYAWSDPISIQRFSAPKRFFDPRYSFSAIIPARHEVDVIKDTINSVASINYPNHLKEIIVVCRYDDKETIDEVIKSLKKETNCYVKLIVFRGEPINKPYRLNHALKEASGNIITIFDAEDEPSREIYNVINTILINEDVDVIQSGVQLMNYRSNWFSTLNVLEYFFWFKSGLQFFYNVGGVTPLGGNTVFFKKEHIQKIGGWDENCLTEDADLGLRLSLAGSKFRIVYDEDHTTKEETPHDIDQFIKQRTRWLQGFLQILAKGDWLKLPGFKKKLFAFYILTSTIALSFMIFIYIPIGVYLMIFFEMPLWITILSYIPMQLMFMQIVIQVIGLLEFTRAYRLKFYPWMPIKILLTYYPYMMLLVISSFRAGYRALLQTYNWEKTTHLNLHREIKSSISQ